MLKKVLKWFLRIFGILFLLGFMVGIYFYFFPTYPDYGISEEYFQTRFQEQGFDSPNNGFSEWKDLIQSLEDNSKIIGEFDMYYKCYLLDSCLGDLKDISEEEKNQKLQEILSNREKMQEFGSIINAFLAEFTRISEEYDYISYLNYSQDEEGNTPVGADLVTYTHLIQLSRGIIFYNHYSGQKQLLKNTSQFYKGLSWLSQNLDSELIGYLSIITLLTPHFEYIETHAEDFSPITKKILTSNLEKFPLSEDMFQNGIKGEYWKNKGMVNNFYQTGMYPFAQNNYSAIQRRFFYNHDETQNLLKKSYYEAIENKNYMEFSNNLRNYFGRNLIGAGLSSYVAAFKKQQDLLEKRKKLIQLLSN